jgi:hypothetical protein
LIQKSDPRGLKTKRAISIETALFVNPTGKVSNFLIEDFDSIVKIVSGGELKSPKKNDFKKT